MVEWFNINPVDPDTGKAVEFPTIERFCSTIGISKPTLHEWRNRYPEFSNAYEKAKQLQESLWIENSMKGRYNTPFTIFLGKNVFGWTDKQTVQHQVSIEDRLRQIVATEQPIKLENVKVEDQE